MAEVLKGNVVAKEIKEEMKNKIVQLEKDGIYPTLGIIRLGNNAGDISYERSIIKACESIGIKARVFEEETTLDTEGLIKLMDKLNKDDSISGILLFRPLPKHIDEEAIKNAIDPKKDVDCMHPLNLEKIFEGDLSGFNPCTPQAAMEILLYNKIDLEGKNVVVINRSMAFSHDALRGECHCNYMSL